VSSAYQIEAIDLSAPRDRTPIIATLASPVEAVHVIFAPGPASLHFGQGGQPWPIVQGKSYEPCPPETDGIFVSNIAAAGFLLLAISFASGPVKVRGQSETARGAAIAIYSRVQQGGSVNSGPAIQLWNEEPIAGRNLIVSRVKVANAGTAGAILMLLQRQRLGNAGGGVLTPGAARFLDRRLAPANPIAATRDAGILGTIAGSTFDNQLYNPEFGVATGTMPLVEALWSARFAAQQNDEMLKDNVVTLAPGWGLTVQHSVNGVGVQIDVAYEASPG